MPDGPIPAYAATLMHELSETLEKVRGQLADATLRELRLVALVETWALQAADPSLADAARATYLDCAEAVTAVYA